MRPAGLARWKRYAAVGKAAVERRGSDVTVLSTMLMTDRTLQAAELLAAEGVDTEVIDLRWLRPLDFDAVRASVEKTRRLVIVEEQVAPERAPADQDAANAVA